MTRYKYIAIEGPIGAGKTTLAHILAAELNGKLILENYLQNPFLEKFYQDMPHHAFNTQIFFLISRYQQQIDSVQQFSLFHSYLIADYSFPKDRIFACLTLTDKELTVYSKIYHSLEKDILKPDLILYLKASTDVLLQRIMQRDRGMEHGITSDYLHSLNMAYNQFFKHYAASPVYSIDTNSIDLTQPGQGRESLIQAIMELLNQKTNLAHYFQPSRPDSILRKEN
ncbi:MAG: deoxynucleoside kinase [Candidatus Delongbacteria bacterium]|nr:deoxynucleoside kinase [Candidatus Delongbacteria bacterium]